MSGSGEADPGRGIRIAIDGPAASGKTTTARSVAQELGYCHLNSGMLYRAVAWAALRDGWSDVRDEAGAARELDSLRMELVRSSPTFTVRVDGVDPGDELQTREVTRLSSELAKLEPVRRRVLRLLRDAGRSGGVVCDGRDIGTVVFPDAELKVFLVASPGERARRRLLDFGESPTPEQVRSEAARLRVRDEADRKRELSPLRRAADAVEIDTTDLEPQEVVHRIVTLARARADEGESGS